MTAAGIDCIAVTADTTKDEDCWRIAGEAIKAYGFIDVLVANAGLSAQASFEESSPELYRQLMEVNFLGPVQIIKACLPMLKKTAGSILITGSVIGLRGIPGYSAYAASKMALTALADTLRIELQGTGVHIGLAYVGITENDTGKTTLDATGKGVIPLERKLRPGKKATQQQVAWQLMRMIEKRQHKRVFTALGKLNAWLQRLAPGISHFVLNRYYHRQLQQQAAQPTPSVQGGIP
jgi:short-subunit dehydrogenase